MDKIWLKHYQEGVPYTIDTTSYPSLVALFEESCRQFSSRLAFVNLNTGLSYHQLWIKSRQLASFLQQLGLKKGARVAIMMPNLLQTPISLFGILQAGFVVVNTNPLYTAPEVIHQMNDSGAEAIIVLANFAKTIENILPHTPKLKKIIITEVGDCFPWLRRMVVNSVVRWIKKMVPSYYLPQALSFNKALEQGKLKPLQPVTLDHQTIAFLQYTGGTTGIAKGAILTHGNLVANILQATAWIKPINLNERDIIITALPLYHIFSLTANCLTFLKVGAKNILITNPRELKGFIKQIKHSGFTALTGVSTLFNALLNHPRFDTIDFSKLKLALAGGMALQKSVAQQWKERTSSPILEAYGLTETSPAVSINPLDTTDYNGSIGLPLPSTDIAIRDSNEQDLPLYEVGELCVKGPQVMRGYWQRADETALVFTKDGFLKTGDLAYMDDKGYLFLVDRKKDMIDVSGFNVYPNEVEQIISMHPGVLEVGVIGIVDEKMGERVKACIVKRDPTLTSQEIIAHCRQYLTNYKIPKVVEFYPALPKTNVGKILRRALKTEISSS